MRVIAHNDGTKSRVRLRGGKVPTIGAAYGYLPVTFADVAICSCLNLGASTRIDPAITAAVLNQLHCLQRVGFFLGSLSIYQKTIPILPRVYDQHDCTGNCAGVGSVSEYRIIALVDPCSTTIIVRAGLSFGTIELFRATFSGPCPSGPLDNVWTVCGQVGTSGVFIGGTGGTVTIGNPVCQCTDEPITPEDECEASDPENYICNVRRVVQHTCGTGFGSIQAEIPGWCGPPADTGGWVQGPTVDGVTTFYRIDSIAGPCGEACLEPGADPALPDPPTNCPKCRSLWQSEFDRNAETPAWSEPELVEGPICSEDNPYLVPADGQWHVLEFNGQTCVAFKVVEGPECIDEVDCPEPEAPDAPVDPPEECEVDCDCDDCPGTDTEAVTGSSWGGMCGIFDPSGFNGNGTIDKVDGECAYVPGTGVSPWIFTCDDLLGWIGTNAATGIQIRKIATLGQPYCGVQGTYRIRDDAGYTGPTCTDPGTVVVA